ncbi:MAG: DNA primase small subunit domain-containing protein [Candidatus Diapherotrites archaeon]|nr:DNA primase small subunit domain-containing protein [Candidatus Diapherotrites archaeon]
METSESFLKKKFQEYYRKVKLGKPLEIEKREFGVGEFGKKITRRHLSFSSHAQFNQFLQTEAPFYVSYSNAYYQFPARTPMTAKKLLSSDLVYEFDADDISTNCKNQHDSWKCPKCQTEGKGEVKICPNCSNGTQQEQWFCSECLNATKEQMLKLIEIIENDFGFSEGLHINFSGNAGYHLHLDSEKIRMLSKEARIQILDYLTFHEMDFEQTQFLTTVDKMVYCPSLEKTKGQHRRLMVYLEKVISEKSVTDLASIGLVSVKKIKPFLENRLKIVEKLRQGTMLPLPGNFSDTQKFWQSLLTYAVEQNTLAIDRQTSVDLHKIIRVPDTLHGGTGFLAKSIPLPEFKKFNPFNDSIVFSEKPVKVFIKNAPQFSLGNQTFESMQNQKTELPEFAAIYLMARQKALLAEDFL